MRPRPASELAALLRVALAGDLVEAIAQAVRVVDPAKVKSASAASLPAVSKSTEPVLSRRSMNVCDVLTFCTRSSDAERSCRDRMPRRIRMRWW